MNINLNEKEINLIRRALLLLPIVMETVDCPPPLLLEIELDDLDLKLKIALGEGTLLMDGK